VVLAWLTLGEPISMGLAAGIGLMDAGAIDAVGA
jgi:hypothetical protein